MRHLSSPQLVYGLLEINVLQLDCESIPGRCVDPSLSSDSTSSEMPGRATVRHQSLQLLTLITTFLLGHMDVVFSDLEKWGHVLEPLQLMVWGLNAGQWGMELDEHSPAVVFRRKLQVKPLSIRLSFKI